MRLNKDIQEVVTQELLAYFNSSSSTDRPNLGHRVIAEFSKNVSVAVVSYINSHNVKISTGVLPPKNKGKKRSKDTSESERESDDSSEVEVSEGDDDEDDKAFYASKASRKGIAKKPVPPQASSTLLAKKDRLPLPNSNSSKKAIYTAPTQKPNTSKEVLLAKSKGQKRTKSSESEIEENSSEDSCDDVNDEDFYVKKASQKGRTKKVVRQKAETQNKKSNDPVPPRPFKITQIVKETLSLPHQSKPAIARGSSYSGRDNNSTTRDAANSSNVKKVLPTTYRDISHVTNDQGKRRKLSPSARNRLEDEVWEKYFVQLVHWHDQHGTYNVPFQTRVEDDEHVYLLYEWLRLQHTYMSEYYSFDPAKYQQLSELMEHGLWTEDAGATSSSSPRPAAASASTAVNNDWEAATPSCLTAANIEKRRVSELDRINTNPNANKSSSSTYYSDSSSPSPPPFASSPSSPPFQPRISHATRTVEVNNFHTSTGTANNLAAVPTASPPAVFARAVPAPRSMSMARYLPPPPPPLRAGSVQSLLSPPVQPTGAIGVVGSALQMLKPKLLPINRPQSQLPPRSIIPSTSVSGIVNKPMTIVEKHFVPLDNSQENRGDDYERNRATKVDVGRKVDEMSLSHGGTNKLSPNGNEGDDENTMDEDADEKAVVSPKSGMRFGMLRKSVPSQHAVLSHGGGTGTDSENEDEDEDQGEESEAIADNKFNGDNRRSNNHLDDDG